MTARHSDNRFVAKDGLKVCSNCKEEKSVTDFWLRTGAKDGYRGKCIACSKSTHDQWLIENHATKKQWDRNYHAENAERINREDREKYAADPAAFSRRNKAWREANPDLVTAANRRKRARHGDDLRARRRQHYQENKSRYKAQAMARQKHVKQATPSWADMEKIAAIYAEAERLTNETGIPHHVDHFYPLRGKTMCGLHVEGNLQIVHAIVNLRKSNRFDESACAPG